MNKQMKKASNLGFITSIIMGISSYYVYNIYSSVSILYAILAICIMLVSVSLRG